MLHLKGFAPKGKVETTRKTILRELERLRILAGGKWQTKQLSHASGFQLSTKIAQAISLQGLFDELISPELKNSLDELAGTTLSPGQGPQLLFSPPQKNPWNVPHLGWHLDVARPRHDRVPGIQVFVLIDDVTPQGGGTVAIAGSHRTHEIQGGTKVNPHQVLREDPFFHALFEDASTDRSRYFKPHKIGEVELHLMEMHGRAGDVFLMDMRVLHAPAPNASRRARIVLTGRYLRKDVPLYPQG